jgi:SAM-dependent methyltransferase
MKNNQRPFEQIREHYLIEKELAGKLRTASQQERQTLYTVLYEELFRLVPHHPQLTRAAWANDSFASVSFQMRNIRSFLRSDSAFLEIGAGSCALATEVTKFVSKVYALDITERNIQKSQLPKNFEFVLSDGRSIPIQGNSIDIAYSYQLMEHLHPDDAMEQLRNIHTALAPGGIYICDTPNRLGGPHDVSRHFDRVATGFHLKEYTITELSNLFKLVGFSKIRIHVRVGQIHIFPPLFLAVLFELSLNRLPYALRKRTANILPIRLLLGIRLIGTK